MEKLLIDTNIIIDLVAKRELFYREAQKLFTLADNKNILLFISSLTFVNAYYVLSKNLNTTDLQRNLIKLKVLVKVFALDDKILELALASNFNDFEDAIQYYTALDNGIDFIITRNKKDFKMSRIPILTADEYLERLGIL